MLIILRQGFEYIKVLLLGKEIHIANILSYTWVNNHIPLVVDNRIEFFGWQSQQVSNFIGQRLEVPDVSNRHHQVDMPHTLTAHLLFGYLHTTPIANYPLVANSFILTTMTFVILHWPKDPLAE